MVALVLSDVCIWASSKVLTAQLLEAFSASVQLILKHACIPLHWPATQKLLIGMCSSDTHAILGQNPLGFGYPKSLLTKMNQ